MNKSEDAAIEGNKNNDDDDDDDDDNDNEDNKMTNIMIPRILSDLLPPCELPPSQSINTIASYITFNFLLLF